MKRTLLVVALFSLLACLWSSWSFFVGNLPREVFFRQFEYGSIGWFVCATWWAYKK